MCSGIQFKSTILLYIRNLHFYRWHMVHMAVETCPLVLLPHFEHKQAYVFKQFQITHLYSTMASAELGKKYPNELDAVCELHNV